MKVSVDGVNIVPKEEETILNIITEIGKVSPEFCERPLAASIGGEIFSLNYVPVRQKDVLGNHIRTALERASGEIKLVKYKDSEGKDIYERTALFVIFLALHDLDLLEAAELGCTIGSGVFVELKDVDVPIDTIRKKIAEIVQQNIHLDRKRISVDEAKLLFTKQKQLDKVALLEYWNEPYVDIYGTEEFSTFLLGELAPSTGYLSVWNVVDTDGGFLFIYPNPEEPTVPADVPQMPKFKAVHQEGEQWARLMNCGMISDLNGMISSGKIRGLIRINEALHEKRFSEIADMICERNAKIVMLAGPSSSGKTTSANRLGVQLSVHGMHPIPISLDDYFINRDDLIPDENGNLDFEHINAINIELFKTQMQQLLNGEEVELPRYNFLTGESEWSGNRIHLYENAVLIVEGLHALNPMIQPEGVSDGTIFKLYVSPLLPLNIDAQNRIPTSNLRLLRRMLRDYNTRGYSIEKTIDRWDSVRIGEKRWIYPFQENADAILNSSTLYELAVLKKHLYPLLVKVDENRENYLLVRNVIKILNLVKEADVDDEIPPTSLVREFIGGNKFYKE